MKWSQTTITINGEPQNAIAPIIISASRATDIPACYATQFAKQFKQGYTEWTNPFSGKKMFVSFEKARLFVFWTKNPSPIIRHLPLLNNANVGYYFTHTLNDYEAEQYELNLPSLDKRIEQFKALSEKIGKEKIQWRFDPLLLSNKISFGRMVEKAETLGNELCQYTNKLIFSFIQIGNYRKVQRNIGKVDNSIREFTEKEKLEFAKELNRMHANWKQKNTHFEIASCAQPENFTEYGISHNKCIDDDLIAKLFPHDLELMKFIGRENTLFPNKQEKALKDKNQRDLCQCIPSKDIGSYNTCLHKCVYCYAGFRK